MGRVVWFQLRSQDDPQEQAAAHGSSTALALTITELKQVEEELQQERNVASAILHTVGSLVVVLDPQGRIVRFNRACEQVTGYSFAEVEGKYLWDLCVVPEEAGRFKLIVEQLRVENSTKDYETSLVGRDGSRRLIAWSSTILPGENGSPAYIIATGIDITERKRLEKAILEISAAEQASHRSGPARRFGATPYRDRIHEQGSGTEARRERPCRKLPKRPGSSDW